MQPSHPRAPRHTQAEPPRDVDIRELAEARFVEEKGRSRLPRQRNATVNIDCPVTGSDDGGELYRTRWQGRRGGWSPPGGGVITAGAVTHTQRSGARERLVSVFFLQGK
jgi:hypothetical protein